MNVTINETVYDLSKTTQILDTPVDKIYYSHNTGKFILVQRGNAEFIPGLVAIELIKASIKPNSTVNAETRELVQATLKGPVAMVKLGRLILETTIEVLEDNTIVDTIATLLHRSREIGLKRTKEYETLVDIIEKRNSSEN